MKLADLMEGVSLISAVPKSVADAEISGLAYDSRKVQPGFLFFAFPAAKPMAGSSPRKALDKGAVAVVSEAPAPRASPAPGFVPLHGRHALAAASGNFFNHPDRRLKIIGVTGTNGKTTTTYLIDSILRAAGLTTALVGYHRVPLAGTSIAVHQHHSRVAGPVRDVLRNSSGPAARM